MSRRNRQAAVPAEWVDEIPVQQSAFKARIVSVAAIMLAALGIAAWSSCPAALTAFLERNSELFTTYGGGAAEMSLQFIFMFFGLVGITCGICGAISLIRKPATYRLLRASLLVVYPLVLIYVVVVWQAVFSFLEIKKLTVDGELQDRATVLKLWWHVCWPALAVTLYVMWLHVMMFSRSVYSAFTAEAGAPMKGDHKLEDARTHGFDPRSRKSLYASCATHLLIFVIIPYLLQCGGCVTPYRVPKGTGEPVVSMVKMVKPKKKKKKKLHLRPNSAIIFEVPDLDHTEVDEQIEEMSQVTYVASANAKAGKMGKGGPGKGGWPEGMENYKIRFIRLEHGGAGWDDGMKQSGADINFLRAFARATGFTKIARKGESHSVRLLKKYPKDGFPPFVYITGNHHLGLRGGDDAKTLREYCLNGGLLIADAGSRTFHHSFYHYITRYVFPDKPFLDIADDDMLYQLPYGFPNGAPAFWHHGGRRALGIKHEGRWCVFYHPGDMNDAWKSPGFSDVKPEMRDAAINLGVNLVYYAFNQWDDAVAKARK